MKVIASVEQLDALPVGTQVRAGGAMWLRTLSHGWVTSSELGNVMADPDVLLQQYPPVTLARLPDYVTKEQKQ